MVPHGQEQDQQDQTVTPRLDRRAVIARGAAATALVWAAPAVLTTAPAAAAVGSPSPGGGGPSRTRQTIRLFSSAAPDGTPDPMVEVLVGGTWRPATAINRPGSYVPFAGTGFVDATDFCADRAVVPFRVPFTLPPGYVDAAITGRAQGDNDVAVRVNGSPVLPGAQADNNNPVNFGGSAPAPVTTSDPAHFTAGLNYVYLDLHNVDCPLAVDVEATVTYLL